jgi:flagellar hook-basal body complex protein FliE
MSAHPTAAIAAVTAAAPDPTLAPAPVQAPAGAPRVSFSEMISDGLDTINQRAADADAQVKAFILDDSIPPHRVIYALEKSQMSLQMMLQVRNKVVEDYQDIMRMQL